MSVVFNLLPKKFYFVRDVIQRIYQLHPDIVIEKRNKNYYFIYLDQQSIRGIDLVFSRPLFKKWSIEITNTVLSHPVEYELTNKLIQMIAQFTKAKILDEADEEVNLPVYELSQSEEKFVADVKLTLQLIKANDALVTIFGVHRKVHFGKRMYQKFEPYLTDDAQLSAKMKDFLHLTQYNIPDFDYAMTVEAYKPDDVRKENPRTLTLLTNKENVLIDKYDDILLDRETGKPIVINNDILNQILPETWKLIDEYTVVAPRLTAQQWENFLEEAAKYDIFDKKLKDL